ncbi:hypothetical protein FRB97_002834 [Tulasnella sp. 331]|nr:hypothetical protein FRB97_002834 [Tulasnella sp. 331]
MRIIEEYNATVEKDGFMKPNVNEGHLQVMDGQLGDVSSYLPDRVVIRIGIWDTGVGIRNKDMVDNRPFSPYVQTDTGRIQGRKGASLGLTLDKHIVRLTGGRLGVRSKRNQGSMFWVELPMGVGQEVLWRSNGEGKDMIVCQTFNTFSRTVVVEAVGATADGDVMPSTF